MSEVAKQVAASVNQAAEALERAAQQVPDCDCETLDADKMAQVVADLMRAEVAAAKVHKTFRALELRHIGKAPSGLATLETQPLDNLPPIPVRPKPTAEGMAKLVEEASSEMTGGQGCC